MTTNLQAEIDAAIEAAEEGFNFGDHGFTKSQLQTILKALQYMRDNQWQPIETAPRDGAVVLVRWDMMPIWMYPTTAFYEENLYANPKAWGPVAHPEYGEIYPTHWMPLPQPPKDQSHE